MKYIIISLLMTIFLFQFFTHAEDGQYPTPIGLTHKDFTFQLYTPKEKRFLSHVSSNVFHIVESGYIDFGDIPSVFQGHSVARDTNRDCVLYYCVPEYGPDILFFQKLIGKEKLDALMTTWKWDQEKEFWHQKVGMIRILGRTDQLLPHDVSDPDYNISQRSVGQEYNTFHQWRYTLTSEKDQTISVRIFPVTDRELFFGDQNEETPLFTFIDPSYDIVNPEIFNHSEVLLPVDKRVYPGDFFETSDKNKLQYTHYPNQLSQWKFDKKYMITQFDLQSYKRPIIGNIDDRKIGSTNSQKVYTIVPYYEVHIPVYQGDNHIQINYTSFSPSGEGVITN